MPQISSAALQSQARYGPQNLSAAALGEEQNLMQDPRTELLSNIDLAASKVEFSASPIVLLCGGPVKVKERPDDVEPPIASLRHALTNNHTAYELFRPEEITTWQSDGVFKNLMDFETDLASICSLVVIVLESPGAIAELGAFSQLPDLSKKIIAIQSSAYIDDGSFIDLGILRYIARQHESSIKSYPWSLDNPHEISREVIEDAIADIQDELSKLPKSQQISVKNNSHVIVFMCEIIRLFVALKESELLDYLKRIEIEIEKEELKRKLFLLEKFKLIKKVVYSDSIFYMRDSDIYHKIRLTPKDGKHIDTLRTSIECMEYYSNVPGQRHRIRAIRQAQRGDGNAH